MKFKATKKEILDGYEVVIPAGYCDLQYLLKYEQPVAYVTRVEGWACDIFGFGAVAIVSGVKPFGNVKTNPDIIKKYDDLGRIISEKESLTHDGKKRALRDLIAAFISEVIS